METSGARHASSCMRRQPNANPTCATRKACALARKTACAREILRGASRRRRSVRTSAQECMRISTSVHSVHRRSRLRRPAAATHGRERDFPSPRRTSSRGLRLRCAERSGDVRRYERGLRRRRALARVDASAAARCARVPFPSPRAGDSRSRRRAHPRRARRSVQRGPTDSSVRARLSVPLAGAPRGAPRVDPRTRTERSRTPADENARARGERAGARQSEVRGILDRSSGASSVAVQRAGVGEVEPSDAAGAFHLPTTLRASNGVQVVAGSGGRTRSPARTIAVRARSPKLRSLEFSALSCPRREDALNSGRTRVASRTGVP